MMVVYISTVRFHNKETKEAARRTLEALRDANLEDATFAEKRDIIAELGIRVYPSEDGKVVRIVSRLNSSAESKLSPQKISMASPKL